MWVAGILSILFFTLRIFYGSSMDARYYSLDGLFEDSMQASLSGTFDHADTKPNSYYYFLKNVTLSPQEGQGTYHFSDFLVIVSKTEQSSDEDMAEVSVQSGNTVQIDGTVYSFQTPTNPGQFDEKSYYKEQNIYYKMYVSSLEVTSAKVHIYRDRLYALRNALLAVYTEALEEKNAGVVCAMLLGDKSLLDAGVKALYQANGIGHILAISGLHVSILCMFFYRLLSLFHFKRPIPFFLTFFFLISYGTMTGFGISTSRAVLMMLFSLAAQEIGRSYDALSALAFSAICVLLQKPYAVTSGSFLLSYSAMLGVILFYPALRCCFLGNKAAQKKRQRKIHRRERELFANSRVLRAAFSLCGKRYEGRLQHLGRRYCAFLCGLPYQLMDSLTFSISIWFATLPAILYLCYEIPTYGILLNLMILPLVPCVVVLSFGGGVCGLFCLPLGVWILKPVDWILTGYEAVCRLILKLPHPIWVLGCPSMAGILCFLGVLACFCCYWIWVYYRPHRKRAEDGGQKTVKGMQDRLLTVFGRAPRFLSGICLALAVFALSYHKPVDDLAVLMLDVGQGDGILLRTREKKTILIDGGSTSVSSVGTYRILPCLKYYGISKIDYMIMTHPDEDHISGQLEIIEAGKESGVRVGCYLLPCPSEESFGDSDDVMIDAARAAKIPVQYLEKGSSLNLGSLSLFCLHPEAGFAADSANAASTVLSLSYGSFHMLLTGDVEENGEESVVSALQEGNFPANYDVLKVAHHGSKYTNGETLLSLVNPRYALISCGKNNSYGHPHAETLERLAACGSEVYTTMEGGAVEVTTDGETFTVGYWE